MRAAGSSGVPLTRKLGIAQGMRVVTWGAPRDFARALGALPEGAALRPRGRGKADLAVWFVRGAAALAAGMDRAAAAAAAAPLWIAWRKRTAGTPADGPSEDEVRRAGLAAGLVDYKVCAIDKAWSALLFARRKQAR